MSADGASTTSAVDDTRDKRGNIGDNVKSAESTTSSSTRARLWVTLTALVFYALFILRTSFTIECLLLPEGRQHASPT